VHHFSARSFEDLRQKSIERARYNADNAKTKGAGYLRLRMFVEYPLSFLRYYVLRRHFTGGWSGVRSSAIGAQARVARLTRMLELAQRKP
jgi:hypothetical protein